MGMSKRDRGEKKPIEYQPMRWIQSSGFNIDDDARWTAAIGGRDPDEARDNRENEIRRLAHFHGKEYARHVAARVVEILRKKNEIAK